MTIFPGLVKTSVWQCPDCGHILSDAAKRLLRLEDHPCPGCFRSIHSFNPVEAQDYTPGTQLEVVG